MPDRPTILIEGEEFPGWERLEVHHALEAAAGLLTFSGPDPEGWPEGGAQRVEVLLGEDRVFRGWIDQVDFGVDGTRSFSVRCRSLTADLIDSHMDFGDPLVPAEMFDQDVFTIAARCAAPFGVPVTHQLGTLRTQLRLSRFAVQPGETGFDAIERACRRTGVILTADYDGRLLLTLPGQDPNRSVLSTITGVTNSQLSVNHRERFGRYVVQGQGVGTDEEPGEVAFALTGVAVDLGVRVSRKSVQMVEGVASFSDCERRAQWEASLRLARSRRLQASVIGWRGHIRDQLWRPNAVLPVELPDLRVSEEMLLESVQLSFGSAGPIAQLGLVPPDSYSLQAQIAKSEAESELVANLEEAEVPE